MRFFGFFSFYKNTFYHIKYRYQLLSKNNQKNQTCGLEVHRFGWQNKSLQGQIAN